MPGAQGKEGISHCGQRQAFCEFSRAETILIIPWGGYEHCPPGQGEGPVWRSLTFLCALFLHEMWIP